MKKILISSFFLCLLLPIFVYADIIDFNKSPTYEINYKYNNKIVLSDVKFNLYKIANYDSKGNISIVDSLQKYNITLEDNANLQTNLIYSYILNENITPNIVLRTDNNGNCKTLNIEVGIYLVSGQTKFIDNYIYIPQKYIITLPYNNDNNMVYDLKSNPKILRIKESDSEISYTSKQISIIWNDNNNQQKLRPKTLIVKLLRNGLVYDEIVLSEENNWHYTWSKLPLKDDNNDYYEYTVVPSALNDYKINLEILDDVYTITNTINNIQEQIDQSESINNYKIPQISLFWWPVYIFLFICIILLNIGIINIKVIDKYKKGKIYLTLSAVSLIISLIILSYNGYISHVSKNKTNNIYYKLIEKISTQNIDNKDSTYMKTISIDNEDYVGYISIPSLNFNIPILNEWNNSYNLPAKFYGTPYSDNIYICSKNYYYFYINLKKLQLNDYVIFNDLNGNSFTYEIKEINVIENKDINKELINNNGIVIFTSNLYSFNKILIIKGEQKNTH